MKMDDITWIVINLLICHHQFWNRRIKRHQTCITEFGDMTLLRLITSKKRVKVKVKQSRYRPGVAQSVPES
jgi:hypothetical protein